MANVHYPLRFAFLNAFTPPGAPKPAIPAGEPEPDDRFRALFTYHAQPVPAPKPQPPSPSIESVFGSNPWIQEAGGVGPEGAYTYNPTYFATRATADKLAQMYGGTVVESDAMAPYGPFHQNQPNELIQFSNGNVLNAGLLVSYFNHGYRQDQIDQFIQAEIGQIAG